MPTFPVPMAFWDFLLLDSEYNKMIVKESAGRIANDNIAETREQIFSKFINLTTGSKSYDDLDSFFGLFSNNFPKEYERLISNEPRNTRKAVKQKIFERFEKVLEFNTTRDKGGRPKLTLKERIDTILAKKQINQNDLGELYFNIMVEFEKLGGFGSIASKESASKKIRSQLKGKLTKINSIFAENVQDSNATSKDFDKLRENPKRAKILFNVVRMRIAVGNVNARLQQNAGKFTKIDDENNEYKPMKGKNKNSYTVYEAILPIKPQIDEDDNEINSINMAVKQFIEAHDALEEVKEVKKITTRNEETLEIDIDTIRYTQEFLEQKDLEGKKYKTDIIYDIDMPILREVMGLSDEIIQESMPFPEAAKFSYRVGDINKTTIEKYFAILADEAFEGVGQKSKKTPQNKKKITVRLSGKSLQSQSNVLYLDNKNSTRITFHPALRKLFASEGSNVFSLATEGIAQATATSYKKVEEAGKEEVIRQFEKETGGVETYDSYIVDDAFNEDTISDFPKLFEKFKVGGKVKYISDDENKTIDENLSAGLVMGETGDGETIYSTKNKNFINFLNAFEKYAYDEEKEYDDDLLAENFDSIEKDTAQDISFNTPAEEEFFSYLYSKGKVEDFVDILTDEFSNYIIKNKFRRMSKNDAFQYLYGVAYMFTDKKLGEYIRKFIEDLQKREVKTITKDLSTEDKARITKIAKEFSEALVKLREQFKNKLQEKIKEIADNPQKISEKTIKRLEEAKLLVKEE